MLLLYFGDDLLPVEMLFVEIYDPWSTENHLRAENAKLLNDLEKERELLRRQEKAADCRSVESQILECDE